MTTAEYKLIGKDDMEASILRRKLYPWVESQAFGFTPVKALIDKLLQECGNKHQLEEPRWETSVFPLYYYYPEAKLHKTQPVYERIWADYQSCFPTLDESTKGQMLANIPRITDAEVDLLIEDHGYFIFVEAKNPPPGQRARFSGGIVHQLVCQFVQGKILEKLIHKEFVMATINAGKVDMSGVSETSKRLLEAVGHSTVDICDFEWSILGEQESVSS